jgi:hypothetical protein
MAYPVAGYPRLQTARPQGTAQQLGSGRIDVRDLSPLLLAALERVGEILGQTITIFSGYRTSAYSASVGGFAGDPHSKGVAVDATVGGKPLGAALSSSQFSGLGLQTGNVPNFYQGKPDPTHVQLTSGNHLGTPTSTATTGSFIDSVLRAIGAPLTTTNRLLLLAWTQAEGTAAKFNPLATTQPASGASNFNSVGVKNYASFASGVNATAQTLQNGHYPGILRSLRAGNVSPNDVVNRYAGEFNTWGTGAGAVSSRLHALSQTSSAGIGGAFGKVLGILGKDPLNPYNVITQGAGAFSGVGTSLNPLDAFGNIAHLVNNLTDPHFWIRALELLAGGVLILTGLYLLARQIGMPSASSAIPTTRATKAVAAAT